MNYIVTDFNTLQMRYTYLISDQKFIPHNARPLPSIHGSSFLPWSVNDLVDWPSQGIPDKDNGCYETANYVCFGWHGVESPSLSSAHLQLLA